MVATLAQAPRRSPLSRRREASLQLLEGALSARRVERQAPWLATLHRLSTGALAGLGLSVVTLSALTLHWQNEWGRSFSELDAARTLEHRLQESAALLEQHHLGAIRRPGQLVPTRSENLIHLSEPRPLVSQGIRPLIAGFQLRQMPAGY
ncbi:MAG: hypothetical protein ACKO0M_07040 [Cyanobium sp.]